MTARAAKIQKLISGYCRQEALTSLRQDFTNAQNAMLYTGNIDLYS